MKGKVGDQYEYLTIHDDATYKEMDGKKRSVYFCVCKCGADVRVTENKWGITESCGCKRKAAAVRIGAARKAKSQKIKDAKAQAARNVGDFLTGYRPATNAARSER